MLLQAYILTVVSLNKTAKLVPKDDPMASYFSTFLCMKLFQLPHIVRSEPNNTRVISNKINEIHLCFICHLGKVR